MIAFGIGFLFSCGIGLLIFCIINLIDTIKHKRTYEFKNASFVVNGLGIFIALSMISITVICFILTQSTVNYDIINIIQKMILYINVLTKLMMKMNTLLYWSKQNI